MQEDKFRERWVNQLGEEGQRRRISVFMATTERLMQYYRDYMLHKERTAEEDEDHVLRRDTIVKWDGAMVNLRQGLADEVCPA